jgi:ribonuclease BN (tRNA processing enzyme)
MSDTITFLGTAGARFVVTTQALASGGLWLNLGGTEILVDPGPGCIVQSTNRKLEAVRLSAIIISHRHLDHANDLNIMTEAMTEGGLKRHGVVFAPADALGPEPVLLSYLRQFLDSVQILQSGASYQVGNVNFDTPVRHVHSVETYGLRFKTGEHVFSYIADSRFFEGLIKSYSGEVLIINVVRLEPGHPYDHLSVADAETIIRELKPKAAILSHFGMTMLRAKPWEVAARLSERTGVRVIAARDGMTYDLARLEDTV